MTAIVQIKGIREGLLVTLGDGTWLELKEALINHVDRQGDFLRGGRLALDVGNQALGPVELCGLRDQLSEQGLTVWAVLSNSPKTIQTAETLGLATRLSKPVLIKSKSCQKPTFMTERMLSWYAEHYARDFRFSILVMWSFLVMSILVLMLWQEEMLLCGGDCEGWYTQEPRVMRLRLCVHWISRRLNYELLVILR